MLKWSASALSDQGVRRTDNQDNFFVSPDQRVFVVADGMGGALGGATASLLTVQTIESGWKENPPPTFDKEDLSKWLSDTVGQANEAVFVYSQQNPAVRGMGTTVVAAAQSDDGCINIAYVGDSRAYLIRKDEIKVLTRDHSLVMELFQGGHITEEQMRDFPFKNYITRCVGHKTDVEIDLVPFKLEENDWVVLCTDGLTAVLNDQAILKVVQDSAEPADACKELVKQTIDGGAPDNVTVIVVKYSEAPEDFDSEVNSDLKP